MGHTKLVLILVILMIVYSAGAISPRIRVAQSIPVDLPKPTSNWLSTYSAWMEILNSAKKTIDIACYYMSLSDGQDFPAGQGGYMGQSVFDAIVNAASQRRVSVRIVQQLPTPNMPPIDTQNLTQMGLASVRSIDFQRLMNGIGGILHTKMIIVDGIHAYAGSANLDWRSLSQVKEVGIVVQDSSEYTADMAKIFAEYWQAAASTKLPQWGKSVSTTYNLENPMQIQPDGQNPISVYIASSPKGFAPEGRVNDLDSMLDIINTSKTSLKFSVMDYMPASLYLKPNYYWPVIDDALRDASYRGVKLELLFSIWNQTNPKEIPYWNSLNALPNTEVRVIKLPDSPFPPPAPFSRVSHSKYMVSDNKSYVTTSNTAADYFLYTGGVSMTFIGPNPISNDLESIFDSDWAGPFTSPVPPFVVRPHLNRKP